MGQRLKTDWILFGTVLLMVSFGMLILYSASSVMAKMDPNLGSSGTTSSARRLGEWRRWPS